METPGKALKRLLDGSLFLIRWIIGLIVAFFINFLFTKFVTIPQHADIFSLIEVLFAVIVTALSIVSSFAIASQWRELDSQWRELATRVQVMQTFEQKAEALFTGIDTSIKALQDESVKNREGVQALTASSDQAKALFTDFDTSIKALQDESVKNREGVQALTASSDQANKNIEALTQVSEQNTKSIESLKTSTETRIADLISIAETSKTDIGVIKASLEAIANRLQY